MRTQGSIRTEPEALAAAKRRGEQYAINEWKASENLPLQAAAAYARVSEDVVSRRRQQGQLYALLAPDHSCETRYPKWQFDVEPKRLSSAVSAFLDTGQVDCWVLHSFMMRPYLDLDGMRPRDYIADPSMDLERLLEVIHRRFYFGDQGAA
jgi:hypothetical protein